MSRSAVSPEVSVDGHHPALFGQATRYDVRGWLELNSHSIHMHAPASKDVHANALRNRAGDVGPRNWKRPEILGEGMSVLRCASGIENEGLRCKLHPSPAAAGRPSPASGVDENIAPTAHLGPTGTQISHPSHTSPRAGIDVALKYYLSVVSSDLLDRPHQVVRAQGSHMTD